jgi:hypothetical protein
LIVEVTKGKLQTASRESTIYPGNAGESASGEKIEYPIQNCVYSHPIGLLYDDIIREKLMKLTVFMQFVFTLDVRKTFISTDTNLQFLYRNIVSCF